MPFIRLFFLRIIFLLSLLIPVTVIAQDYFPDDTNFVHIRTIKATPVKDQYNSNTCWSFAVISLIESELLRQGKGIYNLSELYVVRHAYAEKAVKYIRMHGHMKFTDGGEANDVFDIINRYGIVPEEIYPFTITNDKNYNREMDFKLKAYVSELSSKEDKIDKLWQTGFEDILNTYIGNAPDTFIFDHKKYTPHDYGRELGLNHDDYIMVTSFTHHPFYSRFIIELPDNWSWAEAYNVPLDELTEIIDSAVYKNYSVVWASDISENGFDFRKGLAVINEPVNDNDYESRQSVITQDKRQEAFDNYTTTDDHSMHIIGISRHRDNTKYYLVKNSWGTNSFYRGYLFASEDYVRYKTILIMMNRKALPAEIAEKLNIKY